MVLLGQLHAKLKLEINEAEIAAGSALGRKFLGYGPWSSQRSAVKRAAAHEARGDFNALFGAEAPHSPFSVLQFTQARWSSLSGHTWGSSGGRRGSTDAGVSRLVVQP